MAYVKEGLVLDLEKNTYNKIVVKQNDSGRFLLGKVIAGNTELDLRNNLVVVNGTKKDGTGIFNPVTVLNDRNLFKLELTENMLSLPGELELELKIYDTDTVVTTMNFTILVIESELNGALTSKNEFKIIAAALQSLGEYEYYKNNLNSLITDIIPELRKQVGQNVSDEQLSNALAEKIADGSLAGLTLGDNSVEGSSIKDSAISSAKMSTSYTNLVTEITDGKTIDTSTGLLTDQEGSYVTNLIQVRGDSGIIYKKLYGNRWDNRLYWVSYKSDGTTMITSGLGGAQNDSARTLNVAALSGKTYYIRFVGYNDVCDSSDFVITSTPLINLDWLRITANNFKDKIAKKIVEGSTLALRGNNGFNITITPADGSTTESIFELSTTGSVLAYLDTKATIIAKSDFTITETVTTGDYALIYNYKTSKVELVLISTLNMLRCAIICYLYIYKQSAVVPILCGNHNNIKITKITKTTNTDGEIVSIETPCTDVVSKSALFTHEVKPGAPEWLNVNRVGVDKYATPYPFIFNSTVKAEGGMLVAQAGPASMYNNMDNNLGGHVLQLWAKNNEYRATGIIDERLPDNLPMFTLQSWITKGLSGGGSSCAYGWIKLGTDDFKIIDEVQTSEKTGVYIHPKVSIFATPVIMEAKPLLQSMPIGYEVNSDGTYKLDENNKRVKIDTTDLDPSTNLGKHYDISNKNILQVNEDNELCFHSAKDNKWYKLNMTEITE